MYSLYEELGVTPSAPLDVLRLAFKRRALIVHPDKGGSKEAFQRVMFAFEVLSDSSSRACYDQQLASYPRKNCSISPNVASTKTAPARQDGNRKAKRHRTHQDPAEHMKGYTTSEVTPPGEMASQTHAKRHVRPIPKPPTALNAKTPAAKPENSNTRTGASTQAKDNPRRGHCNVLLERLVMTLHALPVLNRRQALQGMFTAAQRKKLESFMLASRAKSRKPCGQSPSSALCEQIDSSASSDGSKTSDSEKGDNDSNDVCLSAQHSVLPPSSCERVMDDEALAVCDLGLAATIADDPTDHDSVLETVVRSDSKNIVEGVLEVDTAIGAKPGRLDRSSLPHSSIRGLYSFHAGQNAGKYCVGLGVDAMLMTTKRVRDLSLALDHLVVLTEMKQHARASTASSSSARIAEAYSLIAAKWGNSKLEDMGLSFNVQVYNNFWIGRVPLRTPNMHTISNVVEALDSLAPYIGNFVGGHSTISQVGLVQLEAQWEEFKHVFSSLCGRLGHCRVRVLRMLGKYEEAHAPTREQQVTSWNRRQMAAEERRHSQMLKWERGVERWNRASMSKHDRLSRRAGNKHMTHVERLLRRVEMRLSKWWRLEIRQSAREQKQMLRKRAMAERHLVRDARMAARKALAARVTSSRLASRKALAARKARWRAMRNPHLTMADILERRWEPAAESDNIP